MQGNVGSVYFAQNVYNNVKSQAYKEFVICHFVKKILQIRNLTRNFVNFCHTAESNFKSPLYFESQKNDAKVLRLCNRGHAHSLYAEILTRWRNRFQDGRCEVRRKLLRILHHISSENNWLSQHQYSYLYLDNNPGAELPVQETHSSTQSGTLLHIFDGNYCNMIVNTSYC